MSKYIIETPHAAVLVWNYTDRIGIPHGQFDDTGVNPNNLNTIEKDETLPVIISTLSCVSIQTSKAKGSPNGTFNLVLAPFKNWVGNLTAGSWCCIMMSNLPISEKDLKRADSDKVKMFGRIESVRCDTKMGDDGARQTLYYVSGTDWGDVFNSLLYIDNLIKGPNDKGNSQGDVAAIAIRKILFGKNNSPAIGPVDNNLHSILEVMGSGKTLQDHTASVNEAGRLAGSIYEFALPARVIQYFDFRNANGDKIVDGKTINRFISLITGRLAEKDKYTPSNEASGFVDPFSLQGTHSMWQILLENSNPAMNEMLCDLRWNPNGKGGVTFAVYNRIKPFAYKNFKVAAGISEKLKSYFQNIKTHNINSVKVISVNAGTNWRDKINFIEIKPSFSEFHIVSNLQKQKSQVFDENAFKREGFRAMIVDTKQFPIKPGYIVSDRPYGEADWDELRNWGLLMREWYFGTHRMLNGTLVMQGSTPYIGIGENIRFDAGLINPTPNINAATAIAGVNQHILAHIESVQHSFTVDGSGARSYRTTVQFVRGIIVSGNDNVLFGEGMLDQQAAPPKGTSQHTDRNQLNNISTSDVKSDPDPQKVLGT